MTTYTITASGRVDGYGVVQVLEDLENIQLGDDVDISGLAQTGLNGNNQTVWSLTPYKLLEVTDDGELVYDFDVYRPGTVIFPDAGDDLAYQADSGTLTHTVTVSWITNADVVEWLGIAAATANDTAYITDCTAAANAWCYRRRTSAGYNDDPTSVPDGSVFLGTVMYAGGLYRERGSVDSFASFDSQGGQIPFGSLGRILQLLGCNRPQVG